MSLEADAITDAITDNKSSWVTYVLYNAQLNPLRVAIIPWNFFVWPYTRVFWELLLQLYTSVLRAIIPLRVAIHMSVWAAMTCPVTECFFALCNEQWSLQIQIVCINVWEVCVCVCVGGYMCVCVGLCKVMYVHCFIICTIITNVLCLTGLVQKGTTSMNGWLPSRAHLPQLMREEHSY